jgi:hypothetical protein
VGPAVAGGTSSVPDQILVINTLTGARAVWHGWAKVFGARVLAGGQLGNSRLLLPLSALIRWPGDYINDVVISPDGSTLTRPAATCCSMPALPAQRSTAGSIMAG